MIDLANPAEREVLATLVAKLPITEDEARSEADSLTQGDWEALVADALRDRERVNLYDGPSPSDIHPTARLLRLGIASIRAGKPSENFLDLLEVMAEAAIERDVLQSVFPHLPPVKSSTLAAAWREHTIVEQFRKHLSSALGGGMWRRRRTSPAAIYTDAMRSFKKVSDYSAKEIDRALASRWPELGRWITHLRVTAKRDKT